VSNTSVWPLKGGTIGPIQTLGYPILPTKKAGGEEPCTTLEFRSPLTLASDRALKRTGHPPLLQKPLPLHIRQRELEDGGTILWIKFSGSRFFNHFASSTISFLYGKFDLTEGFLTLAPLRKYLEH
jgi:hypothetical protein